MEPGTDSSVEDLLVALAGRGPCTGFEMARAMETAAPGLLDEREGCLYPALAALVREGRLKARWVASNGGPARRVYAPAGGEEASAAGPEEGNGPDGAPPPTGPRLRRAAEAATRSIRDPFAREEARAEVLSHLAAAAAARKAAGLAPQAAEREAVIALGDPWRIRTELRRVHEGKDTLVFPRSGGDRLRALMVYDVFPLLVVLGALLLVRWWVLQPYNIPTKSMEPTLHGDRDDPDFILVDKTAYRRRPIGRWEIAVFLPPEKAEPGSGDGKPAARQPFVKRCVGMGGELLDLKGGDAWVDGVLARRPLDVEDAMMVPIYELGSDLRTAASRARLGPLGAHVFDFTWGTKSGEWTIRGDRFVGTAEAGGEARLEYLNPTTNSYLETDGRRVDHAEEAGDLEVRFTAEALEPGAIAGADLLEGDARHTVRIGPDGVEVRSGEGSWATSRARLEKGRPVEVRFRNVDDRLTVRVDGELVLREELPPRASVPRTLEPGGVEFVAGRGGVAIGGVRILRDVVYLWGSTSDSARSIPEGFLFMMGDNTASSSDSRVWGPVDEVDLIGRPFLVAWPPSRIRGVK